MSYRFCFSFFFFNDPATTEIYTLSLHDALPISRSGPRHVSLGASVDKHSPTAVPRVSTRAVIDRKSTRLNSSHQIISYAVFCLKKKKKITLMTTLNDDQLRAKAMNLAQYPNDYH